ncbi:hypothetical protein [Streptomyces sp. bgisy032]|uniref:hypothetical protein n=1 Tax=Streptomyces sp. bgisy032 TaxID=3413773 RepID=UPI003D74A3ED
MSDLDAYGDPNHECTDACGPYEPLTDRDLEDLEESAHIDALYEVLNLAREHAALMFLTLAKHESGLLVTPRTAAVLLDISEEELAAVLGDKLHPIGDIVSHAIAVDGEDGYIGKAMLALFAAELNQSS